MSSPLKVGVAALAARRSMSQEHGVLAKSSNPQKPQQKSRKSRTVKIRSHKQHHRTMAERKPLSESTTAGPSQSHPSPSSQKHALPSGVSVSPKRKSSTSHGAPATFKLPLPIRFYNDIDPQPDNRGRTLEEILSWDDADLERSHSYIQYLFPLPERSPFNPSAPLLTRDVFEAFRADSEESERLRLNLRKAFRRMLAFYGFGLEKLNDSSLLDAGPQQGPRWKISRSANHEARFRDWVRKFDHNHLRITRIIRCLRLLGLGEEARAFHEGLVRLSVSPDYRGKIGRKSLMFWERAATRRLWNPPEEDDERVVGTGCEFLVDWEREHTR